MIILKERKLTYKSDLKDPKEVQAFFDMIKDAFTDIELALDRLGIIFLDTRWNLQEGQRESLSAYTEAAKKIRERLTVIALMNTTLTKFLANETRPIPIHPRTSGEIDRRTKAIKDELRVYYRNVKGTVFPKFDDEIRQHGDLIEVINSNIDRINEINSAYPRVPAIRHVRSLSEIR
jgi:hypothetical protein